MTDPCTVLIAAADLLPALRERAGEINGDVLTFTDADALPALEAIAKRRPTVVAFERTFAVTPRGAAMINRIKADPTLRGSEIRVLAHDSEYQRVVPRMPAVVAARPALDQRGTRRAPRFRMAPNVTAQVAGKTAMVIDLSIVGAQVVTPTVLKPNQQVAVALANEARTFMAAVVWTSFEIPPNSGPRYRAGLDFPDADAELVGSFCERHKV